MATSTTTHVIASNRPWTHDLSKSLARQSIANFVTINGSNQLTFEKINALSPRYIFFPHWSHKIPSIIYDNFECVIFHMTDLPYGRGGSPLQNLIVRGHSETVVSALRCIDELDAGPVYLKRPLSLCGTAEEIFLRASDVIEEMIIEIIQSNPEPIPQQGEATYFQRRQLEDGDLCQAQGIEEIYDFIRMLDAEGYPPAFVDVGNFRMEFRRPTRRTDGIHADVIIRKRE